MNYLKNNLFEFISRIVSFNENYCLLANSAQFYCRVDSK
jgi:hypothetical protein